MNHVKICLLSLVAMATIVPGVAVASDCIPRLSTLAEDYSRAERIVVAKASACSDMLLSENGGCPDERYIFDVVEDLKDSARLGHHETVFKGGRGTGCGLSFRMGHSYLLFIDEDGNANNSAGSDLDYGVSVKERLQILRQYRDGLIEDLSDPWRFFDHGKGCSISHSFKGIRLEFSYVIADDEYYQSHKLERSYGSNGEVRLDTDLLTPEGESFHGEMIGPDFGPGSIVLSVTFQTSRRIPLATVEGTATIGVGYRVWPLHRRTIVIDLPGATPVNIVSEVAGGDTAYEILDAMSEPTGVVITALASSVGPEVVDESRLRFETRTTQLPSSAEKFKACVDTLAST